MRVLDQVPYIYCLVQFHKDNGKDILALLDFGSKVNAMTLAYMAQLGLKVRKTNLGAQKIAKSSLETYNIIIVAF